MGKATRVTKEAPRAERAARLEVNGLPRAVPRSPSRPLLAVLRDELDLTGAKYGCGEAQCGACTVLLDGRAIRSCITPLGDALGKPVTTIEGLARGDALHPLQAAFIEAGAMQCGYCVPGMILSALGLLGRNADPTEAEIRRALQGNVCRCGTYPRIVRAVQSAARALRGEETR
jgi:aerobic-type carbon monoxide dehydrogenase small subunit (CoxS/CutS family)